MTQHTSDKILGKICQFERACNKDGRQVSGDWPSLCLTAPLASRCQCEDLISTKGQVGLTDEEKAFVQEALSQRSILVAI